MTGVRFRPPSGGAVQSCLLPADMGQLGTPLGFLLNQLWSMCGRVWCACAKTLRQGVLLPGDHRMGL